MTQVFLTHLHSDPIEGLPGLWMTPWFLLVVSNVAAATKELAATARVKPVLARLMSPEQATELFIQIKPRLAVYSHIVKKGLPGAAGDAEIVRRLRAAGYIPPLSHHC